MQSTVWLAGLSSGPGNSLLEKTGRLLRAAELAARIAPGALTAVKLHVVERGSTSFVRPVFVRRVGEEIGLGTRSCRLEDA